MFFNGFTLLMMIIGGGGKGGKGGKPGAKPSPIIKKHIISIRPISI